jgi:hypothetical protein
LILLHKTHTRVEKEKSANDAKVDPVLQSSSQNSSGFLFEVLVSEDMTVFEDMMVLRIEKMVVVRRRKWGRNE